MAEIREFNKKIKQLQKDFSDPNLSPLNRFLSRIDYHDRIWSNRLASLDYVLLNYVLGLYGWLFNREKNFHMAALVVWATWTWPNAMLRCLNISEAQLKSDYNLEISDTAFKVKLGLFAFLYLFLTCVTMILLVTQKLKKAFFRDRPLAQPGLRRVIDLRSRENEKSMPSGDAAACAFQCTWFLFIFDVPFFILIVLPLCMLGRVYAHCHWLGDTVVGAAIGFVCSVISIQYMRVLGALLF